MPRQALVAAADEEEATRAIAASAADAEEEPSCAVCLDRISLKRPIHLWPCAHDFHRTCLIKWFETRDTVHEQLCPNCRTPVDAVRNHHGVDQPLFVDCLGVTGKPTKNVVLRSARDRGMGMGTLPYIEAHIEKAVFLSHIPIKQVNDKQVEYCRRTLEEVQAEHDKSVEAGRGEMYINDLLEELEKVKKRKEIFNEMLSVYSQGGLRHSDVVATEWDYREELIKMKEYQIREEVAKYEKAKREMEGAQSRMDNLYVELGSLRNEPSHHQLPRPVPTDVAFLDAILAGTRGNPQPLTAPNPPRQHIPKAETSLGSAVRRVNAAHRPVRTAPGQPRPDTAEAEVADEDTPGPSTRGAVRRRASAAGTANVQSKRGRRL